MLLTPDQSFQFHFLVLKAEILFLRDTGPFMVSFNPHYLQSPHLNVEPQQIDFEKRHSGSTVPAEEQIGQLPKMTREICRHLPHQTEIIWTIQNSFALQINSYLFVYQSAGNQT